MTRWPLRSGRAWGVLLATLTGAVALGAAGLVWAATTRRPASLPTTPTHRTAAVRPTPPARPPRPAPTAPAPALHPVAVQPEAGVNAPSASAGGADSAGSSSETEPTPAPAGSADGGGRGNARISDAQLRHDLLLLRRLSARDGLSIGPRADIGRDGQAVAPQDAPTVVAQVIQAGNEIARLPYLWGGGHGAWADRGYDCSGSVSFALAGARLLSHPLDSTGLESFGDPGPGRWITIYANGGHTFMIVAGLRFDTGALSSGGTRWQRAPRSVAGFVARHPPGL